MLQDFIEYCKNPVIFPDQKRMTVIIFLKLYLLYMIFVLSIGVQLGGLMNFTGITNELDDVSTKMVLFGVLGAPFFEETIFRLLLKPTRRKVWVFLITLSAYILLLIYRQNYLPIVIFSGILVFVILLILLKKYEIFNFTHYYRLLFYLSVSVFALLHMFNFDQINYTWQFLLLPIFVIPQFFMGLVLGYTRMVYGFIYAVLLHMGINMVMLLELI